MMLVMAGLKGFLLMLSVIVAIGPQNAFLLRQAARREQAWQTAAIFLFGDVTMVLLGGFGIGHMLEQWRTVKLGLTIIGAAYIFWFGLGVFRQLRHPKTLTIGASPKAKNIIIGALSVTFLNPHAIFDTVILVGTLALQFQGADKSSFLIGAISASTVWFFGVAWIGQKLAPFLARPDIWRIIDTTILIIMALLACGLAFDAWRQIMALY